MPAGPFPGPCIHLGEADLELPTPRPDSRWGSTTERWQVLRPLVGDVHRLLDQKGTASLGCLFQPVFWQCVAVLVQLVLEIVSFIVGVVQGAADVAGGMGFGLALIMSLHAI